MSGCLFFDIDGTLVDSEHGEIMPSSSCLEGTEKWISLFDLFWKKSWRIERVS